MFKAYRTKSIIKLANYNFLVHVLPFKFCCRRSPPTSITTSTKTAAGGKNPQRLASLHVVVRLLLQSSSSISYREASTLPTISRPLFLLALVPVRVPSSRNRWPDTTCVKLSCRIAKEYKIVKRQHLELVRFFKYSSQWLQHNFNPALEERKN